MPEYNVELFGAYLLSGYEEVLSYQEYVELLASGRLPATSETDT